MISLIFEYTILHDSEPENSQFNGNITKNLLIRIKNLYLSMYYGGNRIQNR